ncbi:uncharacterized protein V6R79_002851 [Siganus canaliculatus]
MNDQAPEQSSQRARTFHSGSGAQHLPAHSIALRSSTKARDSRLAAGNFRLYDTSTPTIRHFTSASLAVGTEQFYQCSENSVEVKQARRTEGSHTHLGSNRSHGAWT